MLRPERITVGGDPPGDGRSLLAVVKDVIFQGSSIRLIAEAAGGTEMLVTMENDSDEAAPVPRPGEPITMRWAPGASYLLQGRSEIVGATTTDVDEVQATMDGKDVSTVTAAADGEGTASDAATPAVDDDGGSRVNRRALLIGGGVVAVAAVGAVLLSGVGGGGGSDAAANAGDESAGGGVGQGASNVRILNWTEYIDPTDGSDKGTVDRFSDATGISVDYSETFNDNNEVYAKEFAAYLDAGNPTPWDIAMPTYWMAARLKSQGWLAPLPFNLIPNYVNLDPSYLNLDWDPGAKYHLPWQAGFTGIAYNSKVTGRELTKISDLFDPEFNGKIGFFTEMRDSVGLVMLAQGNDPAEATEETMNQALDKIQELTDSNQIRRFTGNDYLQDIQNGNFAACIAWSGDIAQTANPDVHFVFPEEGAMAWFDTMVIPIEARQRGGRGGVDELRVRPGQRGADHQLRAVREPGPRRA